MSMAIAMPAGTGKSGALVGAAHWLDGLVQGPAMTTIAVLAVAATGMLMLHGRVPVRRGLTVAFGCFLVFGASTIARGIAMSGADVPVIDTFPPREMESNSVPKFQPPPPPARPVVADPYAGASVAR